MKIHELLQENDHDDDTRAKQAIEWMKARSKFIAPSGLIDDAESKFRVYGLDMKAAIEEHYPKLLKSDAFYDWWKSHNARMDKEVGITKR